jgi:ABC-type dipeptide/oligopeptide/nickel transport system ATPase component
VKAVDGVSSIWRQASRRAGGESGSGKSVTGFPSWLIDPPGRIVGLVRLAARSCRARAEATARAARPRIAMVFQDPMRRSIRC